MMKSTRREFVIATGMVAGGLVVSSAQPGGVAKIEKEEKMKKIVVAADPFAVGLKDAIVAHLKGKGYEVSDVGATAAQAVPYYDGAVAASKVLQAGGAEKAILFCGTGMGMSIVANRFKGVTAAVVESVFAAKMCRAINNANALCLGQMIWGEWMAKEAVDTFLKTEFTEGLDGFACFLKEAVQKVDVIRPN
jgi:ribose 5-phosphate isomerase B